MILGKVLCKLYRKKQLGWMEDTAEISTSFGIVHLIFLLKTPAQKMRMLMKFATDSKLGGSVNPEVGLSNWKKQRILDDETNRHGMKFN